MATLKITTNPEHRGYRINVAHQGAYKKWVDKIIDLSAHALEVQYQPQGYLISFDLCPGKTIQQVKDAMIYFYRDSSRRTQTPCRPLWATKFEKKDVGNPPMPYPHYHMAVILDGKKARHQSLRVFFNNCQSKGLIGHYNLSRDYQSGRHGKDLNTDMDNWITHASYLCKVATTADVRKPFNTVRFH